GVVLSRLGRFDLHRGLVSGRRRLSFFFSSRRRHTRFSRDWSSDVCSSDLAAPHLAAAGGAILNISDVYARQPRADLAAYATSKGALEAMTRALAVALAPEVRVNALAPGAILWPEDAPDPALQARILARTALGRTGTVEEIADTALWLLRDAGYTTGTVVAVDGGREPV